MRKILVTGAGGFIGTHLVRRLKKQGYWVRGIDLKRPRWSVSPADEFWLSDLRRLEDALSAATGMNWVFHLAADMGGMGYISKAHSDIFMNNTAIDFNVVWAAMQVGVERFFFSSSACVYPITDQETDEEVFLSEEHSYPAQPQGAYGWVKLNTEQMLWWQDKLKVRIARYHNCYGPEGSWRAEDGRAKAPADLCRKVAIAKLTNSPEVEIWGDGQQRRSFMWIGDCIDGTIKLMEKDELKCCDSTPHLLMNIGRSRIVTINELADIISDIANFKIVKKHIDGPQGVRSRSSDNWFCKTMLGWEPETPLEEGLIPTYQWIEEQVRCAIS